MLAIAQHEDRAFAELYDRYGARMYRFFLRMLGRNEAAAEDFTQELFLKIFEKAGQFQPDKNFRTWMYVLAFNLCKNEYRRWSRPAVGPARPEAYEPAPDLLDRQLFEQELRNSINRLNETQRLCFVLRFQEELSVAEIAVIVDCPEGTVKSRLYHAMRQVCRDMEVWRGVFKT